MLAVLSTKQRFWVACYHDVLSVEWSSLITVCYGITNQALCTHRFFESIFSPLFLLLKKPIVSRIFRNTLPPKTAFSVFFLCVTFILCMFSLTTYNSSKHFIQADACESFATLILSYKDPIWIMMALNQTSLPQPPFSTLKIYFLLLLNPATPFIQNHLSGQTSLCCASTQTNDN